MWRIFKMLFGLAVFCSIAFVAYAYVGPVFFRADFAAPTEVVSETVVLELE